MLYRGHIPTKENVMVKNYDGLVIERIAEPLPGGRAQLVEYVFEDGEQRPELTVKRGSPAAADVVRQHEQTVRRP